ncbi:MAG: 2-oxoacid:acceptor oxidoreductase family protein [Clostridia bacterium]
MKPLKIRFCGFGGQGIILSAITLGTALVTKKGYYSVQTQSYGSEARGGQCQAELIVSDEEINAPHSDEKDILVAMSQSALDRYIGDLKEGGVLVVDPALVTEVPEVDGQVIRVPATETAIDLGNRIAANMVLLGFLQEATGIISKDDLLEAIADLVKPAFVEINTRAVEAGIALAEDVDLEVIE